MLILGLLLVAALLYFGIMAYLNRDTDTDVDYNVVSPDYVDAKDPLK